MAANAYKVPKSQWRKWPTLARETFNEVFGMMANNQTIFQHPKATSLPKRQWRTTAWNAAWIAADAVVGAHKRGVTP